MKKIYLTLGLGVLLFGANAQQKYTKVLTASPLVQLENTGTLAKTTSANTLTPTSMLAGGCGTVGLAYYSIAQYTATGTYTVDARGYLFGTDMTYFTTGGTTYTVNNPMAAQKYNVTGTGVTVTNVIVLAGKASSNAGTSMINAKIYSEDGTTLAPNAQIGLTAAKALNTFSTGINPNVLTFATPVPVSAGNFFAAIECPSVGGLTKDTLAIMSTQFQCSSSLDSLSWQYTTYNPPAVPAAWSSVNMSQGDNLDLAIFAVIDIPAGLNSVTKGDLTLLAAFPNPATSEVSINFGLSKSGKAEIEIFDVTGKLINSLKLDNLEIGNHTTKIDISNLNSGVYMYSVKSNNAKMFSKFTVVK
jgi:hypothetical protein